jgi:hypothetical protein
LLLIRLLGKKRLDFFFERHLHHSLRVDIGLGLRGDVSDQVEGRLSVLTFLLLDKLLRRRLVLEFEQEVFKDQVWYSPQVALGRRDQILKWAAFKDLLRKGG